MEKTVEKMVEKMAAETMRVEVERATMVSTRALVRKVMGRTREENRLSLSLGLWCLRDRR